jgi:hypothetical protein
VTASERAGRAGVGRVAGEGVRQCEVSPHSWPGWTLPMQRCVREALGSSRLLASGLDFGSKARPATLPSGTTLGRGRAGMGARPHSETCSRCSSVPNPALGRGMETQTQKLGSHRVRATRHTLAAMPASITASASLMDPVNPLAPAAEYWRMSAPKKSMKHLVMG